MNDEQRAAIDLLMLGHAPKDISARLQLSRRRVYQLLERETEDYIPAGRTSDVWKGARATAARLATSLGISGSRLATLFGVNRSTVSRWRHAKPAGTPLVKIALAHDVLLPNRERLRAGAYSAHYIGREEVCLKSEETERLYFVNPLVLHHHVTLIEVSGHENN